MKLFLTDNGKKPDKVVKKTKRAAAVTPVDPLIVTVKDAISEMSTTNARAVELLDNVVLHLSRDLPTPIIQMDAPVINTPPYPELDPPRQWRVTVAERDAKGFIRVVDLERIK